MQSLTEYFSTIPSSHRSLILIGGLTLFMLLEQGIPFFSLKKYNRTKHTLQNLFFTLTTIIVNFALATILLKSSAWTSEAQFGIIHWTGMSVVLQAILGLMLLDLIGAYLAHLIEHKVKFLWQFHVIHHTDQHVDTTSANRHHPGESVVRFIFTVAATLIVGAPIWLVFLYQSLSAMLSQFNHSNIKVPAAIDKVLKLIICTPDMHRVHHHYRQPYSDTNYGNIFSFWDRIFGTYVEVDNSKLVYGVDTYMNPNEAHNIGFLLKLPFSGYRKPIEYDKEEVL